MIKRSLDEQGRLTVIEHLNELRQRLIVSVLAVAVTTVVSVIFTPFLFELLKSRAPDVHLIRTGVTEMIGTYMKVALLGGVVLALPVILYEIVMFVSPGLTKQERRYLFALFPGAILSFLVGAVFAFFFLLPPALNFLVTFGSDIAEPLIKIGDYVSVVTSLIFWVGIAFETPLVIFFLAKIGVVSPKLLAAKRKYAVLGAFVLAAVITPTPDPINQALVAAPLIVLYEIGILLARLAWRGRTVLASSET